MMVSTLALSDLGLCIAHYVKECPGYVRRLSSSFVLSICSPVSTISPETSSDDWCIELTAASDHPGTA